MELVRAVREERHDRGVAEVPDQEPEQVAGGLVRPVEVLDDEQHGPAGGQPLQDAEQQLEQPALGGIDAETGALNLADGTEIRDEPGQLGAALTDDGVELDRVDAADQTAQRLDDRCVRQRAVTEVDAATLEDLRAKRGGRCGELAGQPRLANAGLAGDKDGPALPVADHV